MHIFHGNIISSCDTGSIDINLQYHTHKLTVITSTMIGLLVSVLVSVL
jgi:hypothetical protein